MAHRNMQRFQRICPVLNSRFHNGRLHACGALPNRNYSNFPVHRRPHPAGQYL